MIENHQRVCKLTFQKMLDVPTRLYGSGIGSSYQQQEETLSKYFLERQPSVESEPWDAPNANKDDQLFSGSCDAVVGT